MRSPKTKPHRREKRTAVPAFSPLAAILQSLRPYINQDAPGGIPAPPEYSGPSLTQVADAFPGQIVMLTRTGPWLWSREFLPKWPAALQEASRLYYQAGGASPGPIQWYQDILTAKRGSYHTVSPFTTLYIPVDVFANIDEQMADSKKFCEAVKRKLIERYREKPAKRGHLRDEAIATGLLIVVLRKWCKATISSIAHRLIPDSRADARHLVTRRIHSTHKMLSRHARGYSPSRRAQC
jgi:hypothetical protein